MIDAPSIVLLAGLFAVSFAIGHESRYADMLSSRIAGACMIAALILMHSGV